MTAFKSLSIASLVVFVFACGSSEPGSGPNDAPNDSPIDSPTDAPTDSPTDGPIDAGCFDNDEDGFDTCGGDCNDQRGDIYPGAPEVCDGVVNDCNGTDETDCICPLFTYECAAGCCDVPSEVMSNASADYPHIFFDAQGNLYATYSIPNSGVWQTGFATFKRATSEWTFNTWTYGGYNPEVYQASTGELVLQFHRPDSTQIKVKTSNDGGATWTDMTDPPGALHIGATCSMGLDANDDPHLMCGMNQSSDQRPRYLKWDGTNWTTTAEDADFGMRHSTTMHLGFGDRPQVVHTYGPDDIDLHFSYYTGTQWLTEPVPINDGSQPHPDWDPAFVLDASDTAHLAFTTTKPGYGYSTWYAKRTSIGEWTLEQAIPNAEMSSNSNANAYLVLDNHGHPVLFNSHGDGAHRNDNGSWTQFDVDQEVRAIATYGDDVYVVYPVDGATYYDQRLHIAALPLGH